MIVPAFLIEAVPEVRAAHDRLLALERERERRLPEWRRLSNAASALGRWDNGKRVPAHGVTTAAFEEARALATAADEEIKSLDRQLSRAKKDLEAAVGGISHRTQVRQAAAGAALELQAEAGPLWERLQKVLADRDEAYRYAGSPGRDWKTHWNARPDRFDGGVTDVKQIMDARMTFDTRALQDVLIGDDPIESSNQDGPSRQVA